MSSRRVLVIDDDESFLEVMEMELSERSFELTCVQTLDEARDQLEETFYPVVLLDLNLEGESGGAFVPDVQSLSPGTAIVVLTGHATVESAVELLKSGVYDYKTKPCPLDELESTLTRAAESVSLRRDNRALREAISAREESHRLIGNSESMESVRQQIRDIAAEAVPVLITGESGTGKEIAARLIHRESPRKNEPFVAVDAGSIPADLFEAELFGHKKGAFTGADESREGLVASADGGTLFFDEVGEIPLDLQAKLLRFFETRQYRRVGESQTRDADVRILSATNRDLSQMVGEGAFREDLYYRLNVVPLEMPTLRARVEDLDQLVPYLIEESEVGSHGPVELTPGAIETLKEYDWPGNVRELKNLVDRLLITCDSRVDRSDVEVLLPESLGNEEELLSLEQVESRQIQQALHQFKGDKKRTADVLGISLKTLYNKIDQYDLEVPD